MLRTATFSGEDARSIMEAYQASADSSRARSLSVANVDMVLVELMGMAEPLRPGTCAESGRIFSGKRHTSGQHGGR